MAYLFRFGLLISALMLPILGHGDDKHLIVGAYHYPPFMNETQASGLYVQFGHAIEASSDIRLEWAFYPYARLDSYFQQGKVDIEIGSSPSWNQHKPIPGKFTQTFYQLEDVAIYRATDSKRASKVTDVHGQDIGIVRGYAFPQFQQAFDDNLARRIDGADESQLLQLLVNERIDQVFMSKLVFLSLQKSNPAFKHLRIGDVVGRYDVAIRVHPNKAAVIDELNQIIEKLNKTGFTHDLFDD